MVAPALLATLLACQSEPPAEVKRALARLEKSPDDGSANATVGRYYLAAEDIEKALAHLKKGSDETLRVAAITEEAAQGNKGPQLVEVGDHWVAAVAKNKAIRQALLDRASFWYAQAWPDLDDFQRAKLKERVFKLYAPTVPGKRGDKPPAGWNGPFANDRFKVAYVTKISHSGGSAFSIWNEGKGGWPGLLNSPLLAHRKGRRLEFSAWVLTDGTDLPMSFKVEFYDDFGKRMDNYDAVFPFRANVPVWVKVGGEVHPPEKTAYVRVLLWGTFDTGTLYLDDIELLEDGKDLLKGEGTFEK